MNIGFDAKRFAENHRGLGNYSRNLIVALGNHAPALKMHLYSPVPLHPEWQPPHFQLPDNATVHAPKKRPSKWRQQYLRFIKIKKQAQEHQLILYHGLSNVLPKRLACPTVVTIHDLIFLHHPKLYPAVDRFYYQRRFKSAAQSTNRIFAVSQATKNDLCDAFSIPPEKVQVIYPSADTIYNPENFSPKEQQRVRKTYQLPQNFILQLGSLEPRKNGHMLLQAFYQLPISVRKDFHIFFVGAFSNYGKKLKRLATSLGISKQVHFLGHVNLMDIPALYAQARACTYLSIMEGFGLPVLEALQCNATCLTSNCSSMPEAGGKACLLADPQDPEHIAHQLQKLLVDDTLRKKLRNAIPKHISMFSAEHISQQIMAGYAIASGENFS